MTRPIAPLVPEGACWACGLSNPADADYADVHTCGDTDA